MDFVRHNKCTFVITAFFLTTVACSHKPVTESSELSPQLDSTPMDHGAHGSDSGKIPGLTSVHFGFDDSHLSPETHKLLQQDKDWLDQHAGQKLQVEGHCDQRGSVEYNLALGDRRAKAVASYLSELGVNKDRLKTISFGSQNPLATGDSEEDFAKNRRVNFVPMQ